MNPFVKLFKSLREIGIQPLWLYGQYQLGLKSGYFLKQTSPISEKPLVAALNLTWIPLPAREAVMGVLGSEAYQSLLKEADLIVEQGLFAYFGGEAKKIEFDLDPERPLAHWTAYESGKAKLPPGDIKYVWEPARFGWAFPLARAYHLSGNPIYRDRFWSLLSEFNQKNPAMMGPNWTSAQEVAIRLVVLALLAPIFLHADEESAAHQQLLTAMFVEYARRIPPTLVYARSQQNNHLITEALGLMVAGSVLECPESVMWTELGREWLYYALRTQIDAGGEYSQKSNNYHRLMLQCAVVADVVLKHSNQTWPMDVLEKLQAATNWLAAEVDLPSGQVSNYGHNDGAYLFQFDSCDYSDYRPVVQEAGRRFLGNAYFSSGRWDEFSLWMGAQPDLETKKDRLMPRCGLKLGDAADWLRLRSVNFSIRPGHADQLHIDVWHQGRQVALDAGTYLYNGEPPWENALMTTGVHNTVVVDGQDQMTRAGKFLWLDWAQSRQIVSEERESVISVLHTGYNKVGVTHQRSCRKTNQGWEFLDAMLPTGSGAGRTNEHNFRIQWLLPDGEWNVTSQTIQVTLPDFSFELEIDAPKMNSIGVVQVCRAGQTIFGEGKCLPQAGWISPLYGVKVPALTFSVTYLAKTPFDILSKWRFCD